MKKIITLSSLALLLLSTSLYADRAEHRDRKLVKTPKHHVKKAHHPVRQKVIHHRPHKHYIRPSGHRPAIHRPKPVVVKHYRPGHRVKRIHRDAFHFMLGGLAYHYFSGVYYRPYHDGYRVVRAPIGAVVYTLPYGYTTVYLNNRNYYHYDDVYYSWDSHRNGYRVVEAPGRCTAPVSARPVSIYQYQPGDIALNLPAGAVEVIIDGRHYFESEGVYFRSTNRDGRPAYRVVEIY